MTYTLVPLLALRGAGRLMPRTVIAFEVTALLGSGSASTISEKQNASGSVSGAVLVDRSGVAASGGQTLGLLAACGACAPQANGQGENQCGVFKGHARSVIEDFFQTPENSDDAVADSAKLEQKKNVCWLEGM